MSITLVSNEVYRSGRPQKQDYGLLINAFQTVISLEGLEEDDKERREFFPVQVISRPISFWQMHLKWKAISATQLDYLADLAQSVKKPLLIHCQKGVDRTGLLCATYRVKYCMGWTPEDAMTEALDMGYHYAINFGLNETWKNWVEYWRSVNAKK